MKKIKFLKRLILTVAFVGCFTYVQSCAMERFFPKTKIKIKTKTKKWYDAKTKEYFKEKRSILDHTCGYYKSTTSAERYLFRNDNRFFNSKDGDKYLNEDNEVTEGRDLTEDRELTNKEKKRIIETIEKLIKNVMKSVIYCDENDFKYTRRKYEKLKIRLESYLDAAKKGIINVKIKDLNDFLLDRSDIIFRAEKNNIYRNISDKSYLVKTIADGVLLRECKYDNDGNLLEKHIYVDKNLDF